MRTLTLFLALSMWLIADDAHQRQVVRIGSLNQVPPKKGKHKVPKPHTAQRVAKPSKRAEKNKDNQPVWGQPNMKRARQTR